MKCKGIRYGTVIQPGWGLKEGSSVFHIEIEYCESTKTIDMLVEAGMTSVTMDAIKKHVSKVDFVFLTHHHYDHVYNTILLKNTFSPKIIIHSLESPLVSSGISLSPNGTSRWHSFLAYLGSSFIGQYLMSYPPFVPDVLVDGFLNNLDSVGIPGVSDDDAAIIHIPGHCKGLIALVLRASHQNSTSGEREVVAFVGDCMRKHPSSSENKELYGETSIYPYFCEDEEECVKSWNKLLEFKLGGISPITLFIPSHGDSVLRSDIENELKRIKSEKKLRVSDCCCGNTTNKISPSQ